MWGKGPRKFKDDRGTAVGKSVGRQDLWSLLPPQHGYQHSCLTSPASCPAWLRPSPQRGDPGLLQLPFLATCPPLAHTGGLLHLPCLQGLLGRRPWPLPLAILPLLSVMLLLYTQRGQLVPALGPVVATSSLLACLHLGTPYWSHPGFLD